MEFYIFAYTGGRLALCAEASVRKKIRPAELITHRFSLKEMEKGFHIMSDKTENYVKIMMVV